ncbi:MAG TPA: choline ABC transporter permease subunit [Peptococcaceae bacterium]|nr:choline ABC transporter permease subunit [Peptococcaceae bacterium]
MFPDALQFHIASYIDNFVKWLQISYGATFDAFSNFLLTILLGIQNALLLIPWWVWVVVVTGLAWWQSRKIFTALVLGGLMMLVGVFELWVPAIETLAIVITSVIISLVIGIPVGVAMAEWDRLSVVITPLLDAMQTMPSFVYLIPALMLFGLGKVPAVIATVIYAVPPVIRLTDLGIRQVSATVQEAARAFGATRWQMLKEVRLPLAMPSILAGVNQTTMMALAMVVVASMIGARGLGERVLLSLNRIAIGNGFEAGFAIVALAIIIDRLTQGVARRWQPPQTN